MAGKAVYRKLATTFGGGTNGNILAKSYLYGDKAGSLELGGLYAGMDNLNAKEARKTALKINSDRESLYQKLEKSGRNATASESKMIRDSYKYAPFVDRAAMFKESGDKWMKEFKSLGRDLGRVGRAIKEDATLLK